MTCKIGTKKNGFQGYNNIMVIITLYLKLPSNLINLVQSFNHTLIIDDRIMYPISYLTSVTCMRVMKQQEMAHGFTFGRLNSNNINRV